PRARATRRRRPRNARPPPAPPCARWAGRDRERRPRAPRSLARFPLRLASLPLAQLPVRSVRLLVRLDREPDGGALLVVELELHEGRDRHQAEPVGLDVRACDG